MLSLQHAATASTKSLISSPFINDILSAGLSAALRLFSRDHPFAFLPNELMNEIFDIAAADSRETAKTMCLVTSWARTIALPHLFRTIACRSDSQLEQFFHLTSEDRPTKLVHPMQFCHNLWIQHLYTVFYSERRKVLPERIMRLKSLCDVALPVDVFLHLLMASRYNPSFLPMKVTVLGAPRGYSIQMAAELALSGPSYPLVEAITDLTLETPQPLLQNSLDFHALINLTHFTIMLPDISLGEMIQALAPIRQLAQIQTITLNTRVSREQLGTWFGEDVMEGIRQLEDRIQFFELPFPMPGNEGEFQRWELGQK